jgi:hypothetical protein
MSAELLAEVLEVLGPLAEHQAAPAPVQRVQDVSADGSGAALVLDERTEHLLDGRLFGPGGRVVGLMDDELARQGRARGGRQCDLVAGGAAVHGDDGLEPVTPVGSGCEPRSSGVPGSA